MHACLSPRNKLYVCVRQSLKLCTGQTERADRQTYRQAGRQTGRQADRLDSDLEVRWRPETGIFVCRDDRVVPGVPSMQDAQVRQVLRVLGVHRKYHLAPTARRQSLQGAAGQLGDFGGRDEHNPANKKRLSG
jgi:hypothetical protein